MNDGSKTRGEKNGRAVLTDAQVEKMRAYRADGWTQQQLADRFGVANSTVGDILRGRRRAA